MTITRLHLQRDRETIGRYKWVKSAIKEKMGIFMHRNSSSVTWNGREKGAD